MEALLAYLKEVAGPAFGILACVGWYVDKNFLREKKYENKEKEKAKIRKEELDKLWSEIDDFKEIVKHYLDRTWNNSKKGGPA